MNAITTLSELVAVGQGDAVALRAPGRIPMTYDQLRAHVRATVSSLRRFGVGRGHRVAIVLPNGPLMASAFVAITAGATSAPLNPAYQAAEFEFYLRDLGARALLVERGSTSQAIAVARKLGVAVLELVETADDPAGRFSIAAEGAAPAPAAADDIDWARADDVALVLHTSGTTSRPKIVPLSQANICASARHIAQTLQLSPADTCMNIMPLFHIHGLMGVVMSSLHAGAAIYCTPGFDALKVFSWFTDARPSWYSAVPTMHQAILARAGANADAVRGVKLRLIRSSSSSLPPQVMTELERTFGAPVIEAYGMTEAAHQMASNPLPPRPRKPGSVGLAAGPDVRIMGPGGKLLPPGEPGEIVIRGPNVTAGYENNPEANAAAFTDGWFRTGDEGKLDEDGYVSITGRLKEIINRGGEKISPREVDEVLMDHPAVRQVVTFAMPHDKLGEDVAAAVVVRDGQEVTAAQLREFAEARLARFKVPRKIVFVTEIPKGPTGKLQRIGLAKILGL